MNSSTKARTIVRAYFVMPSHPILALVGRSGVGKTTLMMELLTRLPDHVFPIRVLTTRERRGPEDDVFCRFTDAHSIRRMQDNGELVQYLEYAGNVYGSTRADIDHALSQGIGIQAYVESGIVDLRNAGYTVIPIKIISDQPMDREEARKAADAERERIPIDYALTVENRFEEGGLEQAVNDLIRFIREV